MSQAYLELDTATLEEEFQVIADCVNERTGFLLRVTRGGYIEYTSNEVPPEQDDLVAETILACNEELVPQPPRTVSDESVARLYSLLVDTSHCLTNAGYDPGPPVSEAVFVDEFRSGEGYWNPFDVVDDAQNFNDEELLDLFELCPDPSRFYWR